MRLKSTSKGYGGWAQVSIGDLVDIKHGFAFKGENIHDEPRGDVLLTPGNFAVGGGFKGEKFKFYDGYVPEEFVLSTGDLLVTMTDLSKLSDTLGYPALVPEGPEGLRYLHNQRLGKVSLKGTDAVDTRFLYYVMCTADYRHEILASATGTTVKHTSPDRIKQFMFMLPPLPEQRSIAHILGTLDDKIELNRRMNETLEAMARAIFEDWFVDFGPVRAKLEGREPYLPPELWDLFPDRLVDSELGEIPEGWEVKSLGDCFNLTMGQSPPGNTYNDHGEGLPFFQGSTDFGARFPSNRKYCSSPNRIAEGGDTLVSVRAPVGALNMAWEKCCIGRGVAALRHKSESGAFTYYSAWAMQSEFERYEQTGTVFGAITRKQFETLSVISPTDELVGRFAKWVLPLEQKLRTNEFGSRSLAAQRDVLLPRLVSGGLEVRQPKCLLTEEAP
ncbi:MAG: restriction endonuclease subunit S [Chloroflexi bacterium]|nr:restriction endonuclease subunit S [Chloroflexota bacterium]MYE40142.1 restriction endonuclease subunit S [Chloroflexota bacterium]